MLDIQIVQAESDSKTGFIQTLHYVITKGKARTYGTVSFTDKDPGGKKKTKKLKPFKNLIKKDLENWIGEKLDLKQIEKDLDNQSELIENPTVLNGLPPSMLSADSE